MTQSSISLDERAAIADLHRRVRVHEHDRVAARDERTDPGPALVIGDVPLLLPHHTLETITCDATVKPRAPVSTSMLRRNT